MIYQPGDIVLLKRPKRGTVSTIWTLMKQLFTFFILRKGLIEAIDGWIHICMVYSGNNGDYVVTEEPPDCHLAPIHKYLKRIYRLRDKPEDFDFEFNKYVARTIGRKYDYTRFFCMFLDRIFKTRWFTLKFAKNDEGEDVCGEHVSRFYWLIKRPCTTEDPNSAIPSDVNAFCRDNPQLFEKVLDEED